MKGNHQQPMPLHLLRINCCKISKDRSLLIRKDETISRLNQKKRQKKGKKLNRFLLVSNPCLAINFQIAFSKLKVARRVKGATAKQRFWSNKPSREKRSRAKADKWNSSVSYPKEILIQAINRQKQACHGVLETN